VFKLRPTCHLSAKRYNTAVAYCPSVPGPTPAPMSTLSTPPSLLEALQLSEDTWQSDLHALFEHARDRFPDILWERDEDDDNTKGPAEVWGHKGTSERSHVLNSKLDSHCLVSRRICSCSSVMASKILPISSCTNQFSNSQLRSTKHLGRSRCFIPQLEPRHRL
jgi:hypothetical protein